MLKRSRILALAVFASFVFGGAKSLSAQTWPPEAAEGGTYTAKPGDQNLTIDHIRLPKNFTINFPGDFKIVEWNARTFEFGENCTIDLSPGPPTEIGGNDLIAIDIRQPDWGLPGRKGKDGPPGKPGRAGITFTLNVGTIVANGSLWIRTDGERGGYGGSGWAGGLGGGSRCKNLVQDGRDGGPGGAGGDAGPGGAGGATARVRINATVTPPRGRIRPVACRSQCGQSTRPSSANGNTGAIVIWGAPGCGGKAGYPGRGGPGGDEGMKRNCGFGIEDRKGGAHGKDGKPAEAGTNGTCTGAPGTP